MVSNESPRKYCCSDLKASSRPDTDSSVSVSTSPLSIISSSHFSHFTIATPSRSIAWWNPAISTSFFTTFITGMGEGPVTTSHATAFHSVWFTFCGSSSIVPLVMPRR